VNFEYILDTNILSELTKSKPSLHIIQFLEKEKDNFCICTPVYQELIFGIQLLPVSKKKKMYLSFLHDVVESLEIQSYDSVCASIHAKLRAEQQKKGKNLPYVDSEIASICIRNDATLVTKNPRDFVSIKELKLKIF
jgi:predicted nucleic acid-binding protein